MNALISTQIFFYKANASPVVKEKKILIKIKKKLTTHK